MTARHIARFYKTAVAAADGPHWRILLDGRPVRSPAGSELSIPTAALAGAVAAEWAAQANHVVPDSMPLMQLCATAIDRIQPYRDRAIADLTDYGGTDLLCYRAAHPDSLAAAQSAGWSPLLVWAETELGARLAVTRGIVPIRQHPEALAAIGRAVAALDDWRLAALHTVTTISGSVVIGLALLRGRLTAAETFDIGMLDENHQIERWGRDAEACARRDRLKAELNDAARYLALLA